MQSNTIMAKDFVNTSFLQCMAGLSKPGKLENAGSYIFGGGGYPRSTAVGASFQKKCFCRFVSLDKWFKYISVKYGVICYIFPPSRTHFVHKSPKSVILALVGFHRFFLHRQFYSLCSVFGLELHNNVSSMQW